ncbi:MAG: glutathione S-transferase family protein [Gaiellales bacterium]
MIELFYRPGTAAMAPHIALEEVGAEYRLIPVNRDGVIEPPEFLDVNPHGLIPAMRIGELKLYESAACLMHIADLYPGAGLAPSPGTPERALYYRWLAYMTNTVQVGLVTWLYPARVAPPEAEAAVKEKTGELLAGMRDFLEGELAAGGPYLLGDGYTGADVFLFMLTRWGRNLEPKWWDLPALGAHTRRIRERPAVQRVFEQEGLEG